MNLAGDQWETESNLKKSPRFPFVLLSLPGLLLRRDGETGCLACQYCSRLDRMDG